MPSIEDLMRASTEARADYHDPGQASEREFRQQAMEAETAAAGATMSRLTSKPAPSLADLEAQGFLNVAQRPLPSGRTAVEGDDPETGVRVRVGTLPAEQQPAEQDDEDRVGGIPRRMFQRGMDLRTAGQQVEDAGFFAEEVGRRAGEAVEQVGVGLLKLAGATAEGIATITGLEEELQDFVALTSDILPMPTLREPETQGGQVVQDISRFTGGFVTSARLLQAAGLTWGYGQAIFGGALTDFFGYTGDEENIVDILRDFEGVSPEVLTETRALLIEALATDASDTEVEKRLKNAGAGALPGVVLDGTVQFYRVLRAARDPRVLQALHRVGVRASEEFLGSSAAYGSRAAQRGSMSLARMNRLVPKVPSFDEVSAAGGAHAAARVLASTVGAVTDAGERAAARALHAVDPPPGIGHNRGPLQDQALDTYIDAEHYLARPAVTDEKPLVTEIGKDIEQRSLRSLGGQAMEETEENLPYFAERMVADVETALRDPDNAAQWYRQHVQNYHQFAAIKFPAVGKPGPKGDVLRTHLNFATAVMSQGTDVKQNAANALHAFEQFMKTGRFPVDNLQGGGESLEAMRDNFRTYNELLDTLGEERTMALLNSDFTVRELQAMSFTVSGELADTRLPGSAIFGPKIGGAFFTNLNGRGDQLTMDLWWMRSWGRYKGQLFNQDLLAKGRETFRAAALADPDRAEFYRIDLTRLDDDAYVDEAARRTFSQFGQNGYRDKSDLTNASRQLKQGGLDMIESPGNGARRNYMRQAALLAQKQLADRGVDVALADIQALLWFGEKDIYSKMGAPVSRHAFDGALADLLKAEGVSDERIQRAIGRSADFAAQGSGGPAQGTGVAVGPRLSEDERSQWFQLHAAARLRQRIVPSGEADAAGPFRQADPQAGGRLAGSAPVASYAPGSGAKDDASRTIGAITGVTPSKFTEYAASPESVEAFLASARRAAGENPDVAFGLDLDPSLLANARLFTTAGPAGKAGTFAIVGDELVAVSKRGAPDGFTFQAALLAVQEGARRATVPANGAEAVLAVAGFRPVARAPGAEGELDRLVMVYDPDALELPDLSKVPSVETLEDAVALQRKEVRRISRRTNDRRRRAAAAAATAAATGGAGGASAAVAPELQQDGESPADAPADAPVPATDMVAGITEDVARSVFQTLKRGQREAERIEDFVPDSTLDAIYDAVHVQGNRVAPLEGIDFNFDKFDSAESTLQVINALATEYEGATTAAKRGVQTFADTQELADRLSAATGDETLKLVLTRKEGQLLNDFQLKAAFDLYEKLAADTVDLTKKLAGPGATPEDAVRLNHRLSLMGAFHAQLKGAQTETARALSAMRMMRGNSQVAAAQIEDILANTGGLETAQAKARILLQEQTKAVQRGANPTGALSQAGRNLERATTLDMVFESWIGGLLSGPVTLFGVNNLGNATLVAANLMERGMAATGRSLLRTAGLSSEEGVAWAEFERYALGTLTGARVGWSLFWDALRTGEPALVTKLGMEGPDYRKAITGENVAQLPLVKGATNYVTKAARNVDARLPGGAMLEPALMRTGSALSGTVDVLGEYYFRMPYRILQAEDQFWQSISYAAELQAQAWRSATDQVQRGTAADVTKRYQEILSNPQDELPDVHIRALQHAREATLAQNPGEAAMFLSRAINTDPLRPLAKVVMPFFRVVNNSLRWTGDRLPMKYFMKHQRDRLLTPAGRDMELAKMTTGAMLIGSGVWFVNTVPFGVSATAGPDVGEPKQRRAALLLNRDGNSITVPWSRIDPDGTFKGWLHDGLDKSYDVRKLEPATTLFLVSAITSEIIKYAESPQEQEEAAMLAIQSFKDVLLDSSWATGIAQFANAVSGEFSPEQGADKMRRYISRVGGSLVPSLAATGRRAVDSTLRDDAPDNPFDTQSGKLLSAMYNSMCNRWPGCSEDLPALVNLFGDEIQLEGALGPDLVSPIYTSTPVIQQGDLERAGLPEYIVQAHTFRNLRLGQNLTREDLERFVDVTGAYGELERLSLPVDKRRREWKGVPLTPAQWNFVTRYEGPRIRAALEDLVRDPLYLDAPEEDDVDGSKQKLMTAIVGMVREETDIQLMSEPEWADVRDARLLREYVRDHGRFPGRTTPLGAGLLGEDVLPDPEASDMPVAPDAAVHELLRGRYQ